MKRTLVLVITSILAVCLMASCGGGVANGVANGVVNGVDAYIDPEETISTGVNQKLTIALDSNPTTGFQWEEDYDETRLELVEKTYKAGVQTGKGIMIGSGGVDYFQFKALKKGETKVVFVYRRPWEIPIAEQKVFDIDIK